MSDRERILDGLKPLFAEARETGKWFWCSYQDLWFSADALEAQHAKGKFIWDAVNWKLRDPQERVAEAQERANQALREVERVRRQVTEGKSGF